MVDVELSGQVERTTEDFIKGIRIIFIEGICDETTVDYTCTMMYIIHDYYHEERSSPTVFMQLKVMCISFISLAQLLDPQPQFFTRLIGVLSSLRVGEGKDARLNGW